MDFIIYNIMEQIVKVLLEYGMTGIFIIVLIYGNVRVFKYASNLRASYSEELKQKEQEATEIKMDFRKHLLEENAKLMNVIEGNSLALKEFSKSLTEFNFCNREIINLLNKSQ